MPRFGSKSPRRAAALLVASGAVLLAAACGGGSDSSTGANGSTGANANGGGGNNAAFTAYIDCLRQNGVTVTMPSGGVRNRPSDGAGRGPRDFPSGRPRPSGSAGERGGGFPGGGGGFFGKPAGVDDATWQKAQAACASVRPSGRGNGNGGRNTAYRNCLQQHGVTLDGGKPATTDPAVKKAMETCKVLSPAPSTTPTA